MAELGACISEALRREWEAYRLVSFAEPYWEVETYPRLRLPEEMPAWLAEPMREREREILDLYTNHPRKVAPCKTHGEAHEECRDG
jgi:hypothetical protein